MDVASKVSVNRRRFCKDLRDGRRRRVKVLSGEPQVSCCDVGEEVPCEDEEGISGVEDRMLHTHPGRLGLAGACTH
jgi:hypothetical protein